MQVHTGPRFVAVAAEDDLPALRPLLAAGGEIVRYHPGLRATVRVGERFAKVSADATTLLAHQRAIWMHRDELSFTVAEPLGAESGVVWLSAVPGAPAGPEHAARAGASLASLHRSSVRATPVPDRTVRAAAELVRLVPSLRRSVEALLVMDMVPGIPRPLHGAPHPPQWLADGASLGLIDFDRLSAGDVEADVAAYMEAAAAEDGGEAVASAFLDGYGPVDPTRLSAYRGRRRIMKAFRAATGLRPDGDERAARRLGG